MFGGGVVLQIIDKTVFRPALESTALWLTAQLRSRCGQLGVLSGAAFARQSALFFASGQLDRTLKNIL